MMKFINTHQQRILSFLLFLILYLLYFQTIDFTTLSNGYKITSLLPLVFIVVYYMFLWFPTIKIKSPFFVMYTLIAFARFVVLSIVTIENGNYNGISGIPVLDSNLTFAGILMICELIITAIFINYWSHKHFKTSKLMNKYYYSSSNKNFYILFFLFSVSLLFIFL